MVAVETHLRRGSVSVVPWERIVRNQGRFGYSCCDLQLLLCGGRCSKFLYKYTYCLLISLLQNEVTDVSSELVPDSSCNAWVLARMWETDLRSLHLEGIKIHPFFTGECFNLTMCCFGGGVLRKVLFGSFLLYLSEVQLRFLFNWQLLKTAKWDT